MLLFQSILEINDTMTKKAFVKLLADWNRNTPHKENKIPDFEFDGSFNKRYGTENLWIELVEYKTHDILAAKYEKVEDNGVIWDTEYIMNFEEMKLCIRLERTFLLEAEIVTDTFSTPKFIDYLIDGGYLKDDNAIQVLSQPHSITEENLEIIEALIKERSVYRLPVIYVTKTFANNDPLDAGNLAYKLKGVCHVFLQESQSTNIKIRALCNDKNPYGGRIKIFYPAKGYENEEVIVKNATRSFDYILRKVMDYAKSCEIKEMYTWSGVRNLILKESQDKLRRQYQEDKNLWGEFSEEFENNEKKIKEMQEEIFRISAENDQLRDWVRGKEGETLIIAGDEKDFFPGERKEILLEELSQRLEYNISEGRRADVINDVIQANDYRGALKKKREAIRKILKDGRMGKREYNNLKELGFDISDEGKHYKIVYGGDPRYTEIMAKTPSDGHSAKNFISKINGKCF